MKSREWQEPTQLRFQFEKKGTKESVELVQLNFVLHLVKYFLGMLTFLHFGMVMYILCRHMWEAYDLLFD